jgi:SAM-dependent methyltransferase
MAAFLRSPDRGRARPYAARRMTHPSEEHRDPRYDTFPDGFFRRGDDASDAQFYAPPRLVTHIDDAAIAAVGTLYERLDLRGSVLDLMSSWISHFRAPPQHLTVLGMNELELARNPMADDRVVHDLNADPVLPFADSTFDVVVCCVSVDYLVRPIEVFDDVARVLRPGGPFVCTFSNRCFPTKAIAGWLATNDAQHCEIVATYFRLARGYDEPAIERVPTSGVDPLYAVWARSGS